MGLGSGSQSLVYLVFIEETPSPASAHLPSPFLSFFLPRAQLSLSRPTIVLKMSVRGTQYSMAILGVKYIHQHLPSRSSVVFKQLPAVSPVSGCQYCLESDTSSPTPTPPPGVLCERKVQIPSSEAGFFQLAKRSPGSATSLHGSAHPLRVMSLPQYTHASLCLFNHLPLSSAPRNSQPPCWEMGVWGWSTGSLFSQAAAPAFPDFSAHKKLLPPLNACYSQGNS